VNMRVAAVAASLPPLAAVLFYLGTPFVLLVQASAAPSAVGGFGRGVSDLTILALRSVVIATASSAVAVAVATACSVGGFFAPRFGGWYRIWVRTLLFVNPVFFVFGFAVLLAGWRPLEAATTASAYILLPLSGLVIQARADQYPRDQFLAARSLGETHSGFIVRHLVPYLLPQVFLALTLSCVYALGFYLVPSFVGLGRVAVAAVAIDRAANSVGDWAAASQLCVVTMLAAAVVVGIGLSLFASARRSIA
jgi:ABC-type spermidine/putrescine transport system permease subunit II